MAVQSELMIHPDLLIQRYRARYSTARNVMRIGTIYGFLGILGGGITALVGFIPVLRAGESSYSTVIIGVAIGIASWASGYLTEAAGLWMETSIDVAVNSSTLLTETQKAEILGIKA